MPKVRCETIFAQIQIFETYKRRAIGKSRYLWYFNEVQLKKLARLICERWLIVPGAPPGIQPNMRSDGHD